MAFDPITFSEVLNNKAPIGSIVRVINSFENPKYIASGAKFDSTDYPVLGDQIPGGFQGDYVHEVPFPSVLRRSAIVTTANQTNVIIANWTIGSNVYLLFKNGSLWKSNSLTLSDGIAYVKTFVAADFNGIAPTAMVQNINGRVSQNGMNLYLSAPGNHLRIDLNDPTLTTQTPITMPSAAAAYFFTEGGGNILANTGTPATTGGVVFSSDNGGSWANAPTLSAAFNYTNPFTYANGTFMSYGSGATNNIIRTTNLGTSWTINTACTVGVGTLAYNPVVSLFVAAPTTAGNIYTSPDGAVWTSRTVATPTSASASRIAIASNGSMVIYCTGTPAVMTSTNGTTWVVRSALAPFGNATNPAANQQYGGVTDVFSVGGTLHMVTAPVGTTFICGSTDSGTTWTVSTELTNMTSTNTYSYPIVNYDGSVVVLMDNVTMGASTSLLSAWTGIISFDSGATWQNISIPSGTDLVCWKGMLITSDGNYVAYGNIGNVTMTGLANTQNGFRTATSPDGINWTYSAAPSITYVALAATALVQSMVASKTSPNVIIATTAGASGPVSFDYGKTWSTYATSAGALVGAFKDKFLVLTNAAVPRYMTTTGSAVTALVNGQMTMPTSATVSSVASDGNVVVMTWANNTLVNYSYDGVTWQASALPSPVAGPGVAIINGWVLIPTNGGTVYRTQDFINWELANVGDDVKYSTMAISSITSSGDNNQGYYNGAVASSTAGYILRAATEETVFRRVPLINSDLPNTKWVVIAK
jgi:hypothetical protein